jgi:hypothetical protein
MNKICYWDSETNSQKERDATVEENAEIEARQAAANDLTTIKLRLAAQIDADRDTVFRAVVGDRATEYAVAADEAESFKLAGYTGTVPESVESWADVKSKSAQWATDDILATAQNWKAAQANMRRTRLTFKENVKAAATKAALDTIMTQWAGYIVALKASLGVS